jgi:hypothetical protein
LQGSAYIPEDEAPLELHIVAVVGAVMITFLVRRGGPIVSWSRIGLGHALGVIHEEKEKGSKGL